MWSLVVSAFSAAGTVGAVIIALWATLHQRQRFKVKDVRVLASYTMFPQMENEANRLSDCCVYFFIENKQSVQIEIFEISITLSVRVEKGKGGLSGVGLPVSMRGNFIPAHSQYEVKYTIGNDQLRCSKKDILDVQYVVKTSAGDVTAPFPEKWKKLLFKCLNFDDASSQN